MSITVASETGAPPLTAVRRVLAGGEPGREGGYLPSSSTTATPPPPGHYYLVTYLLPITPPHFLLSRPASLLPHPYQDSSAFSKTTPLEPSQWPSTEEYNGL